MIRCVGRRGESEVHPDARVMVGIGCGALPFVLTSHHLLTGVFTGLGSATVCIAGYLGWLYGRDRYLRWVVARHTYRSGDR